VLITEPAMRGIWSGPQAAKQRDLELAGSRANGVILACALERLWPKADRHELVRTDFLVISRGEATMRACYFGRTGRRTAAYMRMVLRELLAD
jgi:hypothetical protein